MLCANLSEVSLVSMCYVLLYSIYIVEASFVVWESERGITGMHVLSTLFIYSRGLICCVRIGAWYHWYACVMYYSIYIVEASSVVCESERGTGITGKRVLCITLYIYIVEASFVVCESERGITGMRVLCTTL